MLRGPPRAGARRCLAQRLRWPSVQQRCNMSSGLREVGVFVEASCAEFASSGRAEKAMRSSGVFASHG